MLKCSHVQLPCCKDCVNMSGKLQSRCQNIIHFTVNIFGCLYLRFGLPELQFCELLTNKSLLDLALQLCMNQVPNLLDTQAEYGSIHLLLCAGAICINIHVYS